MSRNDLVERAFGAYFRAGGNMQPSSSSGLCEHNGKEYVVLSNINGVLAVYRVKPDRILRRLKQWPTALG